jgi:hypothetical protein
MATRLDQVENERSGIRRRATSKGLSFGPIATAITVGTVAVLLGVTFLGDWLRTPKITAEASPSLISPNGDQAQDTTNFSYTLNEDSVTVQVFKKTRPGQTITTNQPRGQHSHLEWLDNWGRLSRMALPLAVTAKGTVRAGSQSANVLVDSVTPTLRLANLDEVSRVREANLTIEGLTDPDAVVQLAGDPKIVPIDGEGRFNLQRQLAEGSNTIKVPPPTRRAIRHPQPRNHFGDQAAGDND